MAGVADRCRHAVLCADPFHIVTWATEALDDVRRRAANAIQHGLPNGRIESVITRG